SDTRMGIFSDSKDEDLAAITHIAEGCVFHFNSKVAQTGVIIEISHDFQYISDVGGKILVEFLHPTMLSRVATLVVLSNAFPVFSLRRKDGIMLNLDQRRNFMARFTCLFVQASLSTLSLEIDGKEYFLRWHGFPNDG